MAPDDEDDCFGTSECYELTNEPMEAVCTREIRVHRCRRMRTAYGQGALAANLSCASESVNRRHAGRSTSTVMRFIQPGQFPFT